MNFFKIILWDLFIVSAVVHCAPFNKRIETDPELTAGYFEGDMVLNSDTYLRNTFITPRNGLINATLKWPNNTVYYKFVKGFFDAEHLGHILRAMQIIEELSCIRFKEVTDTKQDYYVKITGLRRGCYSNVGWLNRIQQYNLEIYPLDTGCFRIGTIVHELLHTLGFFHMQSAWDRDNYVRIVKENIIAGMEHNFNKYENDTVDHFDEQYDYGSIMHYPSTAFSDNGQPTIVALKSVDNAIMGQRRILSKSDVRKLNVMYKCPRNI